MSDATDESGSDDSDAKPTVWILGDQLNRSVASLADRTPDDCRVLMVESTAKLTSKRWHRQRAHLVVSAMRHFARELTDEGFDVDYRQAPSLAAGLAGHREEYEPTTVVAMEPMSFDGRGLLERHDVEVVANNQFLCSYQDFAEWADDRSSLKMEDFYRWQRRRLDILMDGDEPVEEKWNFDHDNREPPPDDGRSWPSITRFELDDIDRAATEAIAAAGADTWGREPDGMWPVTREQALTRLDEFIDTALDPFGPHEDAMLADEWKLAHSALSSSLNLGLLHPMEVVERAETAYREGNARINSVEGFIRQIIGWREYVWGLYWLWMPEYRGENHLEADRPVPPAFTGEAETKMHCVSSVIGHVEDNGYAHHIERLMVLGNLALTSGVDPWAMTEWMWSSFVDGAEWVMLPNVIGMALHADGGRMATKPYASGGAYINRMSDFCGDCEFNPRNRTGDDACPFTTLYWDFLRRNRDAFDGNHRMARQLANLDRLKNLDEVADRAEWVLTGLSEGTL